MARIDSDIYLKVKESTQHTMLVQSKERCPQESPPNTHESATAQPEIFPLWYGMIIIIRIHMHIDEHLIPTGA